MKSSDELVKATLEIWENGDFIETITLENKDVSLYSYNDGYYLIWYVSAMIEKVEKITKKTAVTLFPVLNQYPKLKGPN